jgi:hypothetical protein
MTRGVDKSLLIMFAPALLYRLLRLNCNNLNWTTVQTHEALTKEYPRLTR